MANRLARLGDWRSRVRISAPRLTKAPFAGFLGSRHNLVVEQDELRERVREAEDEIEQAEERLEDVEEQIEEAKEHVEGPPE